MFETFTLYGAAAMVAALVGLALFWVIVGREKKTAQGHLQLRMRSVEELTAMLTRYDESLRVPGTTLCGDDFGQAIRTQLEACRTLQSGSAPELGAEMVGALVTQGRLLDHLWRQRLVSLRRPELNPVHRADAQFEALLQEHLAAIRQLLARCGSVATVMQRRDRHILQEAASAAAHPLRVAPDPTPEPRA